MGSVQRTGRCVVLQLAYGIGNPAPYCGTIVIGLGGKLIGAYGKFTPLQSEATAVYNP